jgi:CRP/FNR family transcriptional regulator, cyclic AMP receptor protein
MKQSDKSIIHSSFWANFFNPPAEKTDLKILLKSVPVFSDLSKKDLSLLLEIAHLRNYLAGEYIFYQGDPGIGLHIIRDGEVIVQRSDDQGHTLQLAFLERGDFFGELALVDGAKRSASAIAKKDSQIAVIFKPDIDEFVSAYPKKGIKIFEGLNKIVVTRLRNINEDYFQLLNKLNIETEGEYGTGNKKNISAD